MTPNASRWGEAGRYAYDKLIVSPGIELHYDMLEGYSRESAETKIPCGWIAGSQTELLARQLCAMPQGGTFLLVAPPNPYRCPPGPYERAGKRNYDAPTKLMSEVAKGMTDKQIADVALYYETLAGPDGTKLTVGKTPEKVAVSGQTMQLISKGDPTRAVTPFAACHGTTAEGNSNGKVPVLQGQNQTYLAETLKQYRSGQRSSDIYKEMRFFAVKLTDREIEELSAHYANEKGRNAKAS